MAAPPPPAVAEQVFGTRLRAALRYAELLADQGVLRGVIGPREVERLWDRHLLNSAAVAEVVPTDADVLDVGAGAGLPGIPLALARPDLSVTLLEPLLRRTTFLEDVIVELSPSRLQVRRGRAEQELPSSVDVVVARAVAPLRRLLPLTLPLLRPGGRLVALKGSSAQREVEEAAEVLRRLGDPQVRVQLVDLGVVVPASTVVVVDAAR